MNNMKHLVCPSCGAGLSLQSPYEFLIKCPYCHTQIINESAYQSCNNIVEPNALPFYLTEDSLMGIFVNHLVGLEETPIDLFVNINILSIKKYYVPIYIFQGTFRAPWTAKVPRKQPKQVIKEGKLVEDYDVVYDYPQGEAVGNFSFKSVPVDEAGRIGIDLNYLQTIDINPSKLVPLSSVNMDNDEGLEIVPPAGNADIVWSQYAEQMALNEAYALASAQCPKPNDFFFLRRAEIISCSASCEMKKATLLYIPIWRIDYQYHKNNYRFILYAEHADKFTSSYPHETEKIQANATSEQQSMLDAYKEEIAPVNNICGWGGLGLLVAEFLTIFSITSLFETLKEANFGWYFPLAGLAVIITYFYLDNKIRTKYGVDDINADIADRTEKMVQVSLDYKEKTGKRFIQSNAWKSDSSFNASDLTSAFMQNFSSLKNAEESKGQDSPIVNPPHSNIKYCKYCGKKIDVSHSFCRYCGKKQSKI